MPTVPALEPVRSQVLLTSAPVSLSVAEPPMRAAMLAKPCRAGDRAVCRLAVMAVR